MRNLTKITMLFILAALVSCAKKESASTGMVDFTVFADQSLADVTKSNVSDYTTLPTVENFTVVVKNSSDEELWKVKASEWNPSTQIPVGNYTVTASYGDLANEGFDKPCFIGTESFVVLGNETTDVSVPVSLANAVILVRCTDNFKNYYPEYSFSLMRMSSKIVDFVQGETRGAFIDPYRFHFEGTVKTETGAVKTFATQEYRSLDSATAYTVIFDVNKIGGGSVTVSFNDNLETVELADVELND